MTQNEDVAKLAQADHSQQAASADLPTEAQIREFGTFHYSHAVSDEVYFRSKFNALRECLAHAFPNRALGSMKFGAENTPVAKLLDEFAEHLLRASRNPMYGDNGAFTDLLFEWEETVPLICRYLARRGTPIEALRNLTIEDTRQIEGLRDVFRVLLDSDNVNESGANIVVNVIKANTRITEIHKQHDEFIESKLDDLEAQVGEAGRGVKAAAAEGAKKAVEKTLPLVYAKTANMSNEELEAATKPKTRSSGGGRKKERDLDDAQVKAVLADLKAHKRESFRAHCASIIRTMEPRQYQNPYTTAKGLDNAVRRYCDAHDILLDCSRTGKWSAKS